MRGTGTRSDGLTGFSVNSALGMTVTEIAVAQPVQNNQISYTTVQQLEGVGVSVVPTPTGPNPLHATVNVPNPLTPAQAAVLSSQFRQAPDPVPRNCRPGR